MSFPPPAPGLVLRYSYLWSREYEGGAVEGRKDRPAAVVMATTARDENLMVYVLPITHSKPANDTAAIEVPPAAASRIGLDTGPHWIVISEFNVFQWPGFDLRYVPKKTPKSVAYGFLPSGFFGSVRDAWLKLDHEAKTQKVPRDE